MRQSAVAFLLLLSVSASSATTYVVNPDGTGDFPTIQAAIDASAGGDIVELTDGTFAGDGNRDIDFQGKAITVRSQGGDPAACVIDCQGSTGDPHGGFVFDEGEDSGSRLEGVTVTNGYMTQCRPDFIGGGVTCVGSSPDLRQCVFSYCTGTDGGGGVHCVADASPRFFDCEFIDNESLLNGGGLFCDAESDPCLYDCLFSGNRSAQDGGGMFVSNDIGQGPELHECTFIDNFAEYYGGAVATVSTSLELDRCVFLDNLSGQSGGAVKTEAEVYLHAHRCVFANNVAGEVGGGLLIAGNMIASVTHCTFVRNRSSLQYGAGIACWGGIYLDCWHSIIAFSTWGSGVGCVIGHDVDFECTNIYGNPGGDWIDCLEWEYGEDGNISEDPLFCDLEGGDYTIHADSPCAAGNSPPCDWMGALFIGCTDPLAVGSTSSDRLRFHLARNRPNPFNPRTEIDYTLPLRTPVTLRIFDVAGRLVRELVSEPYQEAGSHRAIWDGRNDAGRRVGSGVYYYRVDAGGWTETLPMVLAR